MKKYDDQVLEVLVEGPSKKAERASCSPMFSSQMAGRSRTNTVVNFANDRIHPVSKGDLVQVKMETVYPHSLAGTIVGLEPCTEVTKSPIQRTPLTLR